MTPSSPLTTARFFLAAWNWNPAFLAVCAAAVAGYFALFRGRGHPLPFLAGVAIVVLALASPLNALAEGYLFSAHMIQHLLLLLVAPALILMGLPKDVTATKRVRTALHPALTWAGGVGAMWFWHVPSLCDLSAVSTPVHAVQCCSLLGLGAAFWWPIAAPQNRDRLNPLGGIVYLFTACLACTALGITIALTPIEVCPIFRSPADPLGVLGLIRNGWGMSADRDRQLGGLLMWVPMCAVYLSAIFVELARWYHEPAEAREAAAAGGRVL